MAKRVIKDENGNVFVEKKPLYKRIWFWILLGALLGVFNLTVNGGKHSQPTKQSVSHVASSTKADTSEENNSSAKSEETSSDVPQEYKSALSKANTYASMMSMSKAAIYDQLTSEAGEKFPAEAANYAIANVKADWNANALKKAKTYQKQMSMSSDAIRDQLTSEAGEKFTPEQADYAIQNLNK